MNPELLKILTLIAQGATTALLPGAAPFVNGILSGVNGLQGWLAQEARNRGVPPEQLALVLQADLEQSLKQTQGNIEERMRKIEESEG